MSFHTNKSDGLNRISASTLAQGDQSRGKEILFLDPGVQDRQTILHNLRPEVEVVSLDAGRPAIQQIAEEVTDRRGLAAVHIMAHGAPGRVCFASGEWSTATLRQDAEDLAAIGSALRPDGELRLWSCETARGATGEAFVLRLAELACVEVAAPTARIGAAALGGTWELSGRETALAPMTPAGTAAYAGLLLDGKIKVKATASPVDGTAALARGTYFVAANVGGANKVVGQFSFLPGYGLDMFVGVSDVRDSYRVHAGESGVIPEGGVCILDPSGSYSRKATEILLGRDGAIVPASPGAPVRITLAPAPGAGR
ncbi:DUF4347 domain-containing protein [Rhodoblastus acidophilus]|uniref:DUF4347 domain-containing protein n=1 Tax=Candidatus Rhodoblastus alkanivorans TaxID=2954117 RepID=A0ABS9Z3P8_9HYPH|nr:DUF4347 domain-containing protein [Candidatus Rhodoblastus alkanivorans]MCI4680522.1 DUF4347 domain-containing protein [Candidatus Rhodoblastus alkanivorans]MCI4682248.1 DUF4347 domain-containing protein [Candidatus Rhodoblastus alkanivorans]MDI4639550.1 DUF4347 domain-containing protein [Rhodoblastus acidophilus]